MTRTVDMINHPPHYNNSAAKCGSCGRPIETIDVTEHMGFNLGNAVKYIWRANDKGNPIMDLEKAAWYIHREIEKRQRESSADPSNTSAS